MKLISDISFGEDPHFELGDIFADTFTKEMFIVTMFNKDSYMLVSLQDGVRWSDPGRDPFNGMFSKFKKVTGKTLEFST